MATVRLAASGCRCVLGTVVLLRQTRDEHHAEPEPEEVALPVRRYALVVFFSDLKPGSRPVVDSVVQALALTDVVVGATVTAVRLALVLQISKRHGTVDPDELSELRG
ncbi:NADH-quinone oxidoreductase subunit K [Streptomyces mirabilis]|uniref:NADH-quinone oxidoreductase subunit K n=1 Tax=Streptomyces mirabilis TaxID=68239 RepID=UPI00372328A3